MPALDDDDHFSDKWTTARERWPGVSDSDIQRRIDSNFLVADNVHISMVDEETNTWLVERHIDNDRGDEATEEERERSIETVGLIEGIRQGAWAIENRTVTVQDKIGATRTLAIYGLLHFASLARGCQRAWFKPANKSNMTVIMSIRGGLKGSKLYHKKTPRWARKSLVELGNLTNTMATATTFLQKIRVTPTFEAAWAKLKAKFHWTIGSVGQSELELKKFAHLNTLYPDWWTSFRSYENCNSILKQSTKDIFIDVLDTRTALWELLERFFQDEFDFTCEAALNHAGIFRSVSAVLKVFKARHRDIIIDVLRLVLPLRSQFKVGVCSFLPTGLDTRDTRFATEEVLERLLQNISASVVQAQLIIEATTSMPGIKTKTASTPKAQSKTKAKKGPKGSSVSAASSSVSEGKMYMEVDPVDAAPQQVEFLDNVLQLENYIMKIDKSFPYIKAFRYISMFAQMTGSITIVSKKNHNLTRVVLSKWSSQRKLMNSCAYKGRNLAPRPSDVDFVGFTNSADVEVGGVRVGDLMLDAPPRAKTEIEIENIVMDSDNISSVKCFIQFLKSNDPCQPISCHQDAAKMLSKAMGPAFMKLQSMSMSPTENGCVSAKEICSGIAITIHGSIEDVFPAKLAIPLMELDDTAMCQFLERETVSSDAEEACKAWRELMGIRKEGVSVHCAFNLRVAYFFGMVLQMEGLLYQCQGRTERVFNETMVKVAKELKDETEQTMKKAPSMLAGVFLAEGTTLSGIKHESWLDMFLAWCEISIDQHEKMACVAFKAILQKCSTVSTALQGLSSVSSIQDLVDSEGIGYTVPATLALFPNQKPGIVQEIIEKILAKTIEKAGDPDFAQLAAYASSNDVTILIADMKTKLENKYIPKPANANQDPVEIRERAVSDANEKWPASETISAWLGRLTKDERAMPIGQLAEYEKRALLNYIQHKFFDFDGDFKRLGKGVELLVMEKRPHGMGRMWTYSKWGLAKFS